MKIGDWVYWGDSGKITKFRLIGLNSEFGYILLPRCFNHIGWSIEGMSSSASDFYQFRNIDPNILQKYPNAWYLDVAIHKLRSRCPLCP